MTTLEDDIRAALHVRAAAHEVVVPDIGQLAREPYASGGSPVPRRRVLVGAAAAVLAAGLGATAVALVGDDDDPKPRPLIQVPPTPGTFGAILTGLGPPVDGSETSFDLPPDMSVPVPDDTGPLFVLRAAEGDGAPLAVIAFAPDTAISSFDLYGSDASTPTVVAGLPAVEHAPSPVLPQLTTVLELDRGDGERLFAAGLGIPRDDVGALAEAALSVFNLYAPWWQDLGYESAYVGPDRNPFRLLTGDERRLGYAVDGRAVTVAFQTEADDPADYAWYVGGSVTTDDDGRRVVRWSGRGRDQGGPVAAWVDGDGGMVSVGAHDEDDLDRAIAAVRMVDQASWDAERARATDPGSRFSSATTEAVSPPTTG